MTEQTHILKPGPMPLYHQLKELLTEKIESGEWEPGFRLPSELELAAEFGVSRITVRQAMQLVEASGLVERRRGVGTFVGRPKVSQNLLALFHVGNEISKSGSVPNVRLNHLTTKKASPAIAAHLTISPQDDVYEFYRTIFADDEPIILFKSWLPVRLFPGLNAEQLESRSIRAALADFGTHVESQHKEVEVAILDADEAKLLDTSAGAPALLVTYLSYLAGHVPFEYRRMLVRGDRCKYFVDLESPELLV
jgi:GntR family transcriptional regulator